MIFGRNFGRNVIPHKKHYKFLIIILTISLSLYVTSPIFAEEFTYCLENTTYSQSWQKPLCFESVNCDVSIPKILFDNDDLNFEYYIQLVQYKTYCKDSFGFTKIIIHPQSFNLKIFDEDFNYMMYNQTTTSLKNIKIELQKDISYRIELETKWQTSEIKDYQFIEDDHGNLVQEKPTIYIQNTSEIINFPFKFN